MLTLLKLAPFLIAIGYGLLMYRFSVWRTTRMLDRQSRPLTDADLLSVMARMARALDLPALRINVFEIEPVNGLAAPDGRIFLTRGFLERHRSGAVSADEIAGVVAHELGHVALGHARRRMIDFTGQNAVTIVLASVLNRFLPVIGIWVANALASAVAARLSRRDEFEADAYASALLIKAGFGTAPQKSLFRKLASLTGGAGGGVPVWLRSHPGTEDRIRAIETNEVLWRVGQG